jgi:hypothetical protein
VTRKSQSRKKLNTSIGLKHGMTSEVGTNYLKFVREKEIITIGGMSLRPHEIRHVGVQKVISLGNLELRNMKIRYPGERSEKLPKTTYIIIKGMQ